MLAIRNTHFVAFFLVALLAEGCAATRPTAGPDTVTTAGGAAQTGEPTAEQRARAAAATSEDTPANRDGLELRAVTALEGADVQLDALRKSARDAAVPADKQPIETQITEAQASKARLYGQLKQLHSGMNQSWDSLRQDVETTIARLNESLGNQRQKANVAPSAQATQPPKSLRN